jgi:8-oxo-dGTP pyrophosphatase MutT (NUDIX family)
MRDAIESAEDFNEIKNELRLRLAASGHCALDDAGCRRSAVKMLLMNKSGEPHVLLTKRSQKVSTHKGQISFPGGVYDECDDSILGTAYRETWEEVGVSRDVIEFIGQFDDYRSIYGHHVSCFVGAIEYPFFYQFNRDEIDDYVEAPLRIFVDMEYEYMEEVEHQGRVMSVYHYFYNGYEIWGLTARILTDFCRKIITEGKKD